MTGGERGLRVCLVGTAPPRRCGIATFTDDLRSALTHLDPANPAIHVALTESGASYDYPPEVVFEIQADQLNDYRAAARFVNQSNVDVVCVQHEFGIFGGLAGRHVEEFMSSVRAPVVTTLHTVVAHPTPVIRDATRRLVERSERIVVLADQAIELLADGYGLDVSKVVTIPHGVPAAMPVALEQAKRMVGLDGRTVVMTFGLLSPDKGIEVMIDALPAVIARHPDVVYVVLGATHPHVRRDHGEAYREALMRRVDQLGIHDHVQFHDRYVGIDELRTFLSATDIYVTPYHSVDQIVSGTLAYAVGMGRVVVSTPYPYARELLADDRGRLMPYADARALAAIVDDLLSDDAGRARLRERAAASAQRMSWPAVAAAYTELFGGVVSSYERRPVAWTPTPLPLPSFAHLRRLTDDCGVFQHAPYGVPDRAHGYCTDDVGRALVAAVLGSQRWADPAAGEMIPRYLSFMHAAQRGDGRFDNLLGFDRRFVPATASEDTLGQAVWGLGTLVAWSADERWRALAGKMLNRALEPVEQLAHTKAVAYAICGLDGYLERFPGALRARRALQQLAALLMRRWEEHRGCDWEWFDEALTYANPKVPEALLLAGRIIEKPEWTEAGLITLDFLIDHTFVGARAGSVGYFDFVGNDGWFARRGTRSVYGQQPIEAGYMVQACSVAWEVTGDERYIELAQAAAEWLLGRNRQGVALYDPVTGRCADGLDNHGVSENAGAESAICALFGLLAARVASGSDATVGVNDLPPAGAQPTGSQMS